MAPILDLSTKIANIISIGQILDILYLLFTILIFVVGFYVYFKVKAEKDKKILLIALGFFFFFLASLANFTTLFDDNLITPWATVFNFLGGLLVLIAVEPMKMYNALKKKRNLFDYFFK